MTDFEPFIFDYEETYRTVRRYEYGMATQRANSRRERHVNLSILTDAQRAERAARVMEMAERASKRLPL